MEVYLDHNASTPVDPEVITLMQSYFSHWYANPNSPHLFAAEVEEKISQTSNFLVEFLEAGDGDIIYTSGATEAINMVLKGYRYEDRKEIITFQTEHKAVLNTCQYLESQGFIIKYLPVMKNGAIDLDLYQNSLSEHTLLVCAMYANNETGVLHPIESMIPMSKSVGAYFCCDITSSIGKIPMQIKGVDFLTFSAHKYYGPKGIGGVFLRKGLELSPLIHGGSQQNGRRSGTLPVPLIMGMGKAFLLSQILRKEEEKRIKSLRDYLESEILSLPDVYCHGSDTKRIYTTSNICFKGVSSEELILRLKKISVSNGSACSSLVSKPSHVLTAMGVCDTEALSSIRISLGRHNTEEEINFTIDQIKKAVRKIRA
ncbi:cysteine desulfurase family protein [Leadbetterella byssophila]|uniref:cysteine desulfurase family protein n=1 Tax=Leadbetterella byssophila TaxID=316068 RepID=UPI0039A0F9E4